MTTYVSARDAAPSVSFSGRRASSRAKRAFDIGAALFLLVILSPLFLAVSVVIVLSDPGPVFYSQIRTGRHGRHFRLFKFRTMRVGADREIDALRDQSEADGPLFKLRDDPRVTSTGSWLRKTSLDELPQLINVVGGSMSLVGPRPALPEEVAAYSERERLRLSVKPGITGLWQVNGRTELAWTEGVDLDLRYALGRTLAMDVLILVQTIPAVVLRRGAY